MKNEDRVTVEFAKVLPQFMISDGEPAGNKHILGEGLTIILLTQPSL